MIEIEEGTDICEDELVFKFSRSGGPGGQNVNKVNSRVAVTLDVANCTSFSDVQKKRILKRLATRANKAGAITVVCQKYRTQNANRRAVVQRLVELLRWALEKKRVRKKTDVPRYAREKRLEEKKQRSALKRQRAGRDLTPKGGEIEEGL